MRTNVYYTSGIGGVGALGRTSHESLEIVGVGPSAPRGALGRTWAHLGALGRTWKVRCFSPRTARRGGLLPGVRVYPDPPARYSEGTSKHGGSLMQAAAHDWLKKHHEDIVHGLADLVAIQSISTDGEHNPEID